MATGLAQVAYAQEDAKEEDRGPYIGLSVGSFSYEKDIQPLIHVDDTTSVYRIIGGYRFNEHFALEGAWGETGDIEDTVTVPTSQGDLGIDVKGEYEVLTIRALGIIPLGERASLYGGIGYYNATVTTHMLTGVGSYDFEDRANGATVVGGVEFKLNRMNIRAEIEKSEVDAGTDAWDVNVGMLFRF
jgi:OOP family OmpA-OmpF porin